jgi:cbb3-type cytochrome oxidase maturation protein
MLPVHPETPPRSRRPGGAIARFVALGMLVAIAAGGAGFVYKLFQFTREALAAEGAEASFALVPVVVFVCVGTGFVFLFLWALLRGQFRDIEEPKYRLLEEDELYERLGY